MGRGGVGRRGEGWRGEGRGGEGKGDVERGGKRDLLVKISHSVLGYYILCAKELSHIEDVKKICIYTPGLRIANSDYSIIHCCTFIYC